MFFGLNVYKLKYKTVTIVKPYPFKYANVYNSLHRPPAVCFYT